MAPVCAGSTQRPNTSGEDEPVMDRQRWGERGLRCGEVVGWIFGTLSALLAGCLREPPPWPSTDSATSPSSAEGGTAAHTPGRDAAVDPRLPFIEVFAADGTAHPPQATPSRPRLLWHHARQMLADAASPMVFHGRPSEALLDDLRAAPLRAIHREAALPLTTEWRGESLAILPQTPLPPGEPFLLAVPGWARRPDGTRWRQPWIMEFRVATTGAGAPSAQSWPADGTAGVPPNVPWIAVRFDDLVRLPTPDTLSLRNATGERMPTRLVTGPCEPLGWTDGWCWRLELLRPLDPLTAYEVVVGEGAVDRFGEPLGGASMRFRTDSSRTSSARPTPAPLECALDERPVEVGCLLRSERWATLRVRFLRPVRLQWSAGMARSVRIAPRGEALLRVVLPSPTSEVPSSLEARGLADVPRRWALSLPALSEPLAPLSIVEVENDPLGPEPDQEYVELLHFGEAPLSLRGICLSDTPDHLGDCIEHDIMLPPGARVLLVSDRFDPRSPEGEPVPPGVPLVRLGPSLGRGGLSNRGEPLFLRDASGRRISAAPSLPSMRAGSCLVRTTSDPRRGDAEAFRANVPCTPGRPNPVEAP